MLFSIAHRANWDRDRMAIRVGYSLGRERGAVIISATTISALFGQKLAPADCVRAYHQNQIQFEMVAEALCRAGIVEPNGDIVIEPSDMEGG